MSSITFGVVTNVRIWLVACAKVSRDVRVTGSYTRVNGSPPQFIYTQTHPCPSSQKHSGAKFLKQICKIAEAEMLIRILPTIPFQIF